MSCLPLLQCKNLSYPIARFGQYKTIRRSTSSMQSVTPIRNLTGFARDVDICGMWKDRENTCLEYTTRCIFDLRAFEIWILLRAHLDFKCRGPWAAISHSSDSIFSRSLPPPPSAIILRYRASTTWVLSVGRCALASCAPDFGIGIKRYDPSIRTVKICAQIALIRCVQSMTNLKVLL